MENAKGHPLWEVAEIEIQTPEAGLLLQTYPFKCNWCWDIRPLSPLLVFCPSGYLFPTYTYFLENQQILREGRDLPDKASAGLWKKGVYNNIQQCQLPILTYTVSLPSASLRNEGRLRERGGEKRSHFSENGETEQYNGLATSPKCLSYTSSELKIRSYLVCWLCSRALAEGEKMQQRVRFLDNNESSQETRKKIALVIFRDLM